MTMNGMNYTESFAWKMNIQRPLIFMLKLIQKALGWPSLEEERGSSFLQSLTKRENIKLGQ